MLFKFAAVFYVGLEMMPTRGGCLFLGFGVMRFLILLDINVSGAL